MGNRKDQMHVGNGQEFPLTGRQPLLAGIVQTLRAMPVAAAVVRDGDDMTASRNNDPGDLRVLPYGNVRWQRAPSGAVLSARTDVSR